MGIASGVMIRLQTTREMRPTEYGPAQSSVSSLRPAWDPADEDGG
jgi:hypothetical protein